MIIKKLGNMKYVIYLAEKGLFCLRYSKYV